MKEREISLVDLIVEILLRWRVIVIAMLIGGVVMGGLSYGRSYRAVQAQRVHNEELKEQMEGQELETSRKAWLEEKLTPVQLAGVDTLIANEKLCGEQENYYNNSVLLQLDANNIPRVEVIFYVGGQDVAEVTNLVRVYGDLVGSGELLDRLADKLEVSRSAMNELVVLKRNSTDCFLGSNNFSVAIICDTEEKCETASEELISYMQEQCAQLIGTMGEHTLSVVSQSSKVVSDSGLLDKQRTLINNITSFKTIIGKAKDAFSDEEWDYYNFLTGDSSNVQEKETDLIPIVAPGVSVKYIVLGMILAAFLYVFVIFLQYILNTRIRCSDNIALIYDVPLLGHIAKEQNKKRPFSFIDRLILSIRNRNKRNFSTVESIELAAVAVRMSASKMGLDTVYFIGCDMQKGAAEACENIGKILTSNQPELIVLNNVLYDAEAMEKLASAGGVVLVETIGVTLYDEIARELELVRRQGIPVLGCIVVE